MLRLLELNRSHAISRALLEDAENGTRIDSSIKVRARLKKDVHSKKQAFNENARSETTDSICNRDGLNFNPTNQLLRGKA